MAFKGTIREKTQYTIEFSANSRNTGTTVLGHAWVPRTGSGAISQIDMVAPSAIVIQAGTSPAVATHLMLRVDVDVPDGGGGLLAVKEAGAVVAQEAIANDVTWVFALV
jgi:hypothetical protein